MGLLVASRASARLERMQLTNEDEPVEVSGSQVIQESESK
jgi:hypothetical protein